MRWIQTLVAILQGKAIVVVKKDEAKAEVMIGKEVNERFAVQSMVGAVKAMML